MNDKAPPYTDLEDLVNAATDQAVDERVLPAVKELKDAREELVSVTTVFTTTRRRIDAHEIWLVILTIIEIADIALHFTR